MATFTDDTDYYCYFYDHTTEQIYYTSYASLSFLMTDPMDVTAAYVLSANLSDIEYITSVQQNGQEDVVQHIRKYYSQEELDARRRNLSTTLPLPICSMERNTAVIKSVHCI